MSQVNPLGPVIDGEIAICLRNVIGISYRKVPRAIEKMFGIRFTPATLIGFEKALAKLAEAVVDDIAKQLSSAPSTFDFRVSRGSLRDPTL